MALPIQNLATPARPRMTGEPLSACKSNNDPIFLVLQQEIDRDSCPEVCLIRGKYAGSSPEGSPQSKSLLMQWIQKDSVRRQPIVMEK